MKKRILIGYAHYGTGHVSIANHIKNYFVDKDTYEVLFLNLSSYSNYIGKLGYNLFDKANKNELLFTFMYEIVNNKLASKGSEKLCIKSFDNYKLRKIIKDFNPDLVISTHFYMSYMVSYYNKEGIINSKLMTILTDFAHHEWWTINHKTTDYFIVKNEIIKNSLIKHGVSENKIFAYGTPISKEVLRNIDDKKIVLKKYSLTGNKPIYLFFAGGSEGFDYIYDYFKCLVKKDFPIDIIFVSGKNKKLKIKCEEYVFKNDIKNVIVLGYTKDIFNLINIADVVITKPGGSTLSECIEMKTPCILIPGVGGQEIHNARFMSKKHYAIKARGSRSLTRKVKLCLNYPFIVNSMKNKLYKINDVDSCKSIYNLVEKALKK